MRRRESACSWARDVRLQESAGLDDAWEVETYLLRLKAALHGLAHSPTFVDMKGAAPTGPDSLRFGSPGSA